MLPETDVAGDDAGLNLRKFGRSQILLTQQTIDGAGADAGKESAFGINPGVIDVRSLLSDGSAGGLETSITRLHQLNGSVGIQLRTIACAEEYRSRSNERNQFMRVNGQRVPPACIFEVVAGHPVILVRGGDVLDRLAVLAAMKLRAALT